MKQKLENALNALYISNVLDKSTYDKAKENINERYINSEHQNETPNIRENKEEKKVCEHKRKFYSHSDQDYCPDCDKFTDEF